MPSNRKGHRRERELLDKMSKEGFIVHRIAGSGLKDNAICDLIAVKDGEVHIGSNWCCNPQEECPRKDMKTGEGYHLCKDICQQQNHAEVDLLRSFIGDAEGATVVLVGHYYLCDPCRAKLMDAGIKEIVIVDDLICQERKK